MNFTKNDFPILRWSIVAICASILFSSSVVYFANTYTVATQQDLRKASQMRNNSSNSLNTAHQDRDNMSIYADEYGSLINRKIVGEDMRLDWIEGMENLRQKNLVTNFRYNISPQKRYVPNPPVDSGNLDINYSEMKLQFDLLHEEQLVDFFTALPETIPGWYQLEGCTLNRSASTGPNDLPWTHLKAICTGGWITLKSRSS